MLRDQHGKSFSIGDMTSNGKNGVLINLPSSFQLDDNHETVVYQLHVHSASSRDIMSFAKVAVHFPRLEAPVRLSCDRKKINHKLMK